MVVVVVVVTTVVCVAGAKENCPSISSADGSNVFCLWIIVVPSSPEVISPAGKEGEAVPTFVIEVEATGACNRVSTRDVGNISLGLRGGSIIRTVEESGLSNSKHEVDTMRQIKRVLSPTKRTCRHQTAASICVD